MNQVECAHHDHHCRGFYPTILNNNNNDAVIYGARARNQIFIDDTMFRNDCSKKNTIFNALSAIV
ncbi:hypothetical protein DERP_005892 [Dermatophagoides pteronyssinus]|uniref:Uncharacterized protein n=1 Tax=Dermatophagoides pteronyssinus TaxID=6956 RepID=A0ABQ8JAF7_DERPT|nr:hypothetical protein DERP_005892 [Dermatophagoides pteronyssinus]